MVMEVMVGTTNTKDIVFQSLKKEKYVVTGDKALIVEYLGEIDIEFCSEAAICGGIPVIKSMQSDFVGNEIKIISGTINSCTNFMLPVMVKKGQSYDGKLKEVSMWVA